MEPRTATKMKLRTTNAKRPSKEPCVNRKDCGESTEGEKDRVSWEWRNRDSGTAKGPCCYSVSPSSQICGFDGRVGANVSRCARQQIIVSNPSYCPGCPGSMAGLETPALVFGVSTSPPDKKRIGCDIIYILSCPVEDMHGVFGGRAPGGGWGGQVHQRFF
ncbi:unnamed protein product [Tuber aestivum]|uniref:Uncharacterized protein n=1 Tax=Tuber aestivum TaxID=59557 RepID=A0A292PRF4_9PEZI|nr:unnamed protein product [Tuber aestivum]